ncbi:MAG: hypothetical protein KatS3mg060_1363 [Dehalococcoidia bacterium]|nr:MAG: hypothetical protein KatS3mg060_1363 [Dehalococcoidia bacterium]
MEFRQGIPAIDLWVKRGTGDVPSDGKYHVLHGGVLVASFRQKSAALARYKELLAASGWTPPKRETLDRDELIRQEDIARDLDRGFDYWSSAFSYRSGGRGRNR